MSLVSWFMSSRRRRIYLDYASAPPVRSEAIAAMREGEAYIGNPGAIHQEAVEARAQLQGARERIAKLLGVKSRELIFTSGLTESNNLAIVGYGKALERAKRTLKGTHWVVSSIEHSSILECFGEIERLGGSVTFVDPDSRGIVTPDALSQALRPDTVFVSVGWANNELGTIQPLRDIAAVLRAHEHEHKTEIIFHSDAGQALLYISTLVHSLGVDLLSLGANKLYGPHGIGALYLSNRVTLVPLMLGGKQERGLRAGTENLALALGFAAACEADARERDSEARRLEKVRDTLAQKLTAIAGVVINGDIRHALPHMLNISIPTTEAWRTSEYVALQLDRAGIAVSTKSACREGEESRSHAVAALGRSLTGETLGGDQARAQNTLRFSLGRATRAADIEHVVRTLQRCIVAGEE